MIRWLLGAVIVGVVLAAALLWWTARQSGGNRAVETGGGQASTTASAGSDHPETAARHPAPDLARLAPEPKSFGSGHRISLREYRANQALPGGDWRADLLRVEVCAGQQALRGGALPSAFALGYVLPDGDVEYRSAASSMTVLEPSLSTRLAGEELAAGDCREGWVAFVLGEGRGRDTRQPDRLRFDNRAFGFVPEGSRGELEWTLAMQ